MLDDLILRGTTMIGDVNLFLKGSQEDEEFESEIEIMIAGSLTSSEK